MDPQSCACGRHEVVHSRREFLTRSALGLGAMALADLTSRDRALADDASRQTDPLAGRAPHFPATAKRVILLFMQGGPSHVDTFDPKPQLRRLDGQPLPASFQSKDLQLQFMKASDGKLMASPFAFRKRGESGCCLLQTRPRGVAANRGVPQQTDGPRGSSCH